MRDAMQGRVASGFVASPLIEGGHQLLVSDRLVGQMATIALTRQDIAATAGRQREEGDKASFFGREPFGQFQRVLF